MRKAVISALMMTLLLLTGCGEREARLEKGFEQLRQAVTVAQSITAQVELTADDGDTISDYTLALAYDGQETAVEILSPELIAGIRATALRGEVSVSYQGAILGAGALDEEGVTPVSALPVMLNAMASAYVELLWWEGDQIAARLYVGENSVLTLWLDGDTYAPVAGEIAAGGRRVITCRFTDWVAA